MKNQLCSLLLVLALAACKKEDAVSYSSDDMVLAEVAPATKAISMPASANPVTQAGQKIIRSATLRFQVDDLPDTHDRILSSVKKYGGYVQNDHEAKEYQQLTRSLELRVPSKHFDDFLAELSQGVSYFDQKDISARDVSEEYVDIDARIKAQKALENRYLELLKKAGKVTEMLEIEKQLSEIREEIEARQARLQYLQQQVDMSSFSITFYKVVPDKEDASVSFGSKMGNAIISGVNSLLDFFIWLLGMWPFILILVALMVFLRKRRRRKIKQ